MKNKVFTQLIFLFIGIVAFGQTYSEKNPILIEIYCGAIGTLSEEVSLLQKAITTNNDSLILVMANSDNIKLKLLSIIAIENLSIKDKIALTVEQNQLIDEFKKRKDIVRICEACEGQFYEPISKLFSKRKTKGRKAIDYCLRTKE